MIDARHLALIKTCSGAIEMAAQQEQMAATWRGMGRETVAWECESNARTYRAHAARLQAENAS